MSLNFAKPAAQAADKPASERSGPGRGAVLYTFDCRRADGSPICLEARELGSDADALAWSRRLLGDHLSCSSVEVLEADRFAGPRRAIPTSRTRAPCQWCNAQSRVFIDVLRTPPVAC